MEFLLSGGMSGAAQKGEKGIDPLFRAGEDEVVFAEPGPVAGREGLGRLSAGNQADQTAAMALCDDSVSIDDPQLLAEEKLAIILGTEGDGLAETTIADCDYTVKIPMSHGVDSLNVAAASAVACWQLGNR